MTDFKKQFQYVRVIAENGFTAAEVRENLRAFLVDECRLTEDETALFISNTAEDTDVARLREIADDFGFDHLRGVCNAVGLNMGSQLRVLNGCRRVFGLLS